MANLAFCREHVYTAKMETKDSYQQGLTRLEADVASLQKMKDRPSKNEVAIDILDRVLGVARG